MLLAEHLICEDSALFANDNKLNQKQTKSLTVIWKQSNLDIRFKVFYLARSHFFLDAFVNLHFLWLYAIAGDGGIVDGISALFSFLSIQYFSISCSIKLELLFLFVNDTCMLYFSVQIKCQVLSTML